jgi:Tfp pilus assembly protein PilZ
MQDGRIVLIGHASEDIENLKTRLSETSANVVHHFDSASLAIESLQANPANMLGFTLPLFDQEKMVLLYKFRDLGFDVPMLIYARTVAKNGYRAVEGLPKAVILESPCERKRLVGLAQKMMDGEAVRQQQHRRFVTDQTVRVEPFRPDSNSVFGRIRNLSVGGAYVQCDDPSFNVGDLIRFHVHLSALAKKHVVSAQVMWRSISLDSMEIGYGVAFMKSGDVYQNLLKRM